jgi:hypothetical protein
LERALHGGRNHYYLREDFIDYGDGRPLTAENAAIRVENPNSSKRGWIVRFTIREKKKVFDKYFRDDDYGGKNGSYEAIKRYIKGSINEK